MTICCLSENTKSNDFVHMESSCPITQKAHCINWDTKKKNWDVLSSILPCQVHKLKPMNWLIIFGRCLTSHYYLNGSKSDTSDAVPNK